MDGARTRASCSGIWRRRSGMPTSCTGRLVQSALDTCRMISLYRRGFCEWYVLWAWSRPPMGFLPPVRSCRTLTLVGASLGLGTRRECTEPSFAGLTRPPAANATLATKNGFIRYPTFQARQGCDGVRELRPACRADRGFLVNCRFCPQGRGELEFGLTAETQ